MAERAAGTPSNPPTEREPTTEDVIVVGQAAGNAVDPETQTPQEAREAVREATTQKAQQLKISLHPDAITAIADGTIAELERRGAFRQSEAGEANEGEQRSEAGDQSQHAESAAPEPTPRKPTLAERFLGGR